GYHAPILLPDEATRPDDPLYLELVSEHDQSSTLIPLRSDNFIWNHEYFVSPYSPHYRHWTNFHQHHITGHPPKKEPSFRHVPRRQPRRSDTGTDSSSSVSSSPSTSASSTSPVSRGRTGTVHQPLSIERGQAASPTRQPKHPGPTEPIVTITTTIPT
ncbi:hypothetical protein H4R33_007089, partial [Dimargaris cristalligena]